MKYLKLRISFLILLNLSLLCIAGAQSPSLFDIKNLVPTSPEAAMMARFGDIPVGYYTGTANISIPLYSIKEAGLEIPVVLRYHSSGVKVEDEATNVGLGWNLDAGGAVIQIVNGKEDPFDNLPGWDLAAYNAIKGGTSAGVYQSTLVSEWQCGLGITPNYTTAIFSGLKTGHGQPDIFQYNFPGGYSGKFFINPENNQIVLLNRTDDIKFEGTPQTGWTATTLDGHKFFFSILEKVWHGTITDNLSKTYKLNKIVFNTGKEVDFGYYSGGYSSHSYSENIHKNFVFNIDAAGEVLQRNTRIPIVHETKTLVTIESDEIIIQFNLEDRADLLAGTDTDGDNSNGVSMAKRIKSVDIKNRLTGQLLKTFRFSYDYFPFTTLGSGAYLYTPGTTPQSTIDILGKRLRLLSLQEVGYTSAATPVTNPPYEFTYDATVLPLKTSFARDFWGYYNARNNTSLIPDFSFYYFSGYPEYTNMPASLLDLNGANRTTNLSTLTAGILKSIKYPTGGHTNFEYEPHQFGNYDYPDQNVISAAQRNVQVKDQNNTSDTYNHTFQLNRTQKIRFTVSMQRGPGTSVTFLDMLPSTVTLTKIVGIGTPGVTYTTMKTWQMINHIDYQNDYNADGLYQWIEDIDFPYEAGAVYSITANMANGIPPQNTSMNQAGVMAQFRYYDVPANGYALTTGAGVRIASVASYSDQGSLASKKLIKYIKEDQSTSGLLMAPLKHLQTKTAYFLNAFPNTCASYQWGQSEIWFMASESYIPYSTGAGGNAIGYSRVEEIDVTAEGTSKGKRIYYYYNEENSSHPDVPEDPDLRNGQIQKEEIRNEASQLLMETTYTYESLSFVNFNGMKLVPRFFGHRPCDFVQITGTSPGSACFPREYQNIMHEYSAVFYPIRGAWYKTKTKQVKTFDNGIPLTVKEEYVYDSKGLLTTAETHDSKQRKITTVHTYPTGTTPGLGSALEVMAYTNRYNTLLQTRVLIDDVEKEKTKYNYTLIPGQPTKFRPLSLERSIDGGTLHKGVEFFSQAPYERVEQYEEKGNNVSIIWSDNYAYPVASIKGLTGMVTADAAYTSFEANQSINKGNWQYSGTPSAESGSPTGKRAYNLNGSNNITKSGLTAAKVYVVSYWTTNSSPFNIAGTQPGYPVQAGQVGTWRYFEHRITNQTAISIGGTGLIDELRLYTAGAQMDSRSFDTFLGMTSLSDANNRITYYEYDVFGRLSVVRDQFKNVVKKICYNYNGQPENCNP